MENSNAKELQGVEMKALPDSFDDVLSDKVKKHRARRVAKLPSSKVISKSQNDHSRAAFAYWQSFDDRPSDKEDEYAEEEEEDSPKESSKEDSVVDEVVVKTKKAKKKADKKTGRKKGRMF